MNKNYGRSNACEESILAILRETPGISQNDVIIQNFPGFSDSYTRYRIKRLIAEGIIRYKTVGNRFALYLVEDR
jgi:DNA-binding Lrp family transcriptional regulator